MARTEAHTSSVPLTPGLHRVHHEISHVIDLQ